MADPLIEYLRTVDSPTLSNAIELLNVRPRHEGFAPLTIRCLFPELGVMCGYAVTAQVETVTSTGPRDDRLFLELYRQIDEAKKPVVVVFQEVGGFPDFAAHCGEIMATIMKRVGAVGVVSDCAVRDVPEVRRLRFHYFARGTVASHAYFRIVRVNVPVQVCGLPVKPGAILHGDENGLLLVPEVELPRLQEKVTEVREREGRLLEYVRSDLFTLQGLSSLYR